MQVQKHLAPCQLLSAVCADNEGNVQKAGQLLTRGENYGCAAHTAELVTSEVMDRYLIPLMARCRVCAVCFLHAHSHAWQALVQYFRGSPKNAAALKSVQNGRGLKLLLNGETRWNSTYDMLERVKRLLPAIRDLADKLARGVIDIAAGLDQLLLTREEERGLDLALDVRLGTVTAISDMSRFFRSWPTLWIVCNAHQLCWLMFHTTLPSPRRPYVECVTILRARGCVAFPKSISHVQSSG